MLIYFRTTIVKMENWIFEWNIDFTHKSLNISKVAPTFWDDLKIEEVLREMNWGNVVK